MPASVNLKKEEYEDIKWFEYEDEVDYSLLYTNRHRVLYKAFDRFKRNIPNDFNSFCEQNSYWLDGLRTFLLLLKIISAA